MRYQDKIISHLEEALAAANDGNLEEVLEHTANAHQWTKDSTEARDD